MRGGVDPLFVWGAAETAVGYFLGCGADGGARCEVLGAVFEVEG